MSYTRSVAILAQADLALPSGAGVVADGFGMQGDAGDGARSEEVATRRGQGDGEGEEGLPSGAGKGEIPRESGGALEEGVAQARHAEAGR